MDSFLRTADLGLFSPTKQKKGLLVLGRAAPLRAECHLACLALILQLLSITQTIAYSDGVQLTVRNSRDLVSFFCASFLHAGYSR
jgi:hypothetical protein